MKQERAVQKMSKNDMLDEVFNATCKLELMQTVLGVLINMVEKEEVKTPEQAMKFAANQNVIDDFLHITLDGVCYAIQTLDGLQNDNTEYDPEEKNTRT